MGIESIKVIPVHLPKQIIFTKIANGTHTFRCSSTKRLCETAYGKSLYLAS